MAPWQDIVARKRALRDAEIAKYLPSELEAGQPPWPSESERAITGIADLEELQVRIETGELSAEAVVGAYICRAALTHSLTNSITEPLFTSALQAARDLDTHFQQNGGRTVGPLHGVPVTVKDQFDVKGVDSTLGYVGRAFRPVEKDAVLIQILKGLGAVVVAKTNLPQSIMVGLSSICVLCFMFLVWEGLRGLECYMIWRKGAEDYM
jgi:amidase